MLYSGNKFRASFDKKTLVLSEIKILNETKNHKLVIVASKLLNP